MDESERLLEIYKIHVELSDKVSERRGQTNMFYITLLSGIIALLSISNEKDGTQEIFPQNWIFFIVGITGFLLCVLWYFNIRSYRQLNSGKFKALHELESRLDYPFFAREWELLGRGEISKKYYQLSKVEQLAPIILFIPYLILIIISILCFMQ